MGDILPGRTCSGVRWSFLLKVTLVLFRFIFVWGDFVGLFWSRNPKENIWSFKALKENELPHLPSLYQQWPSKEGESFQPVLTQGSLLQDYH